MATLHSPIHDFIAELVGVDRLSEHFVRYRLRALEGATLQAAQPGQFVMLEAPGVLLRRPFSLLDVDVQDGTRFDLLIWVGGTGGTILASLAPGARLRGLGPLGKGFPSPERGIRVVCVGGGFGVAPFHLAIRRWSQEGGDFALFAGARTIHELPFLGMITDALHQWSGAHFRVTTEDGSFGSTGRIVDEVEPYLVRAVQGGAPVRLYACGSKGMLRAVAHLGNRLAVPTWVSLEERMACGFGGCQGCPVELAEHPRTPPLQSAHGGVETGRSNQKRFARVCVDGPVFPLHEVVL